MRTRIAMHARATCRGLLLGATVLLLSSAASHAQPVCDAPELSDAAVRQIVEQERARRTDLPAAFRKFRTVVRRQGCHYAYIEYGLPAAPEYNHIFKLNQHGVIVDVQTGGESEAFECPERVLTQDELAAIVKRERGRRSDLPLELASYEARVDRLRCLYLYFEYALPKEQGHHHVFTIDPHGELMEFYGSPRQ